MQAVAPLPHIHGNARIEKITAPEPSLQFATDEARWSYAVSFELDAAKSLRGTGEPRAVFDLEVEDGEIGIGCTTADYTSYLDREVFVPSGMRRKVYVPIGAPGAASHLMLRNVSVRGRSVARVHGLEFRRVTAAEEIQEQLRTSGPIGAAVPHGAAVVQAIGPRVPPPDFQPILIETEAQESSNAVSFGLTMPRELGGTGQRRVVVDLEVEAGAVGIGCTTADYSAYVDREMFVPQGNRRKVYVPVGPLGAAGHLMFRNASLRGGSVARIHSITVNRVEADQEKQENVRSSLWDAPLLPPLGVSREGEAGEKFNQAWANLRSALGPDVTRVAFPIAVTHTSRVWDMQRSSQEFLRNRYARPRRFDALPPFEELPPCREARSHSGHLTLFDLSFTAEEISLTSTRCIDSEFKIQHVCRAGDRLVICLEDYVLALPDASAKLGGDAEHLQIERIDDPWFAGLHTVFPVDASRCIISASGPDALLLLDLAQSRVIWRWRLPADRYGRNYELTDQMSVHEHYIHNDIQLAHLNCAFPDDRGGFWISTLGQGDIGHVKPDGSYNVIASGFVGCHGIRYSQDRGSLYFSDTCTGRLIGIGEDCVPRTIGAVESLWLHDVQHLAGDIFVLCVGDKNAIVVLDASSNTEVARFDMKARGENVQFINLIGEPALCDKF